MPEVYEENKRRDEVKKKKVIEDKEVGVQSSQAKIDGQKKFLKRCSFFIRLFL